MDPPRLRDAETWFERAAAMVALATVTGWAVLGDTLDRAFGRTAPVELGVLRTELQRMLRGYALGD